MASDLNILNYKFLKSYENKSVEEETFGSNLTEAVSDELQPAGSSPLVDLSRPPQFEKRCPKYSTAPKHIHLQSSPLGR
ncbi:hypothetical protein TNCV_1239081 [Trichonephila clavipes]|nr:hypothetical protein TNCV_1239081 [Trichonephila clavipes]